MVRWSNPSALCTTYCCWLLWPHRFLILQSTSAISTPANSQLCLASHPHTCWSQITFVAAYRCFRVCLVPNLDFTGLSPLSALKSNKMDIWRIYPMFIHSQTNPCRKVPCTFHTKNKCGFRPAGHVTRLLSLGRSVSFCALAHCRQGLSGHGTCLVRPGTVEGLRMKG